MRSNKLAHELAYIRVCEILLILTLLVCLKYCPKVVPIGLMLLGFSELIAVDEVLIQAKSVATLKVLLQMIFF
jgi:hypothetical protein